MLTIMNIWLPREQGQEVGQNVGKTKSKDKEEGIQPAMRRKHKESQDVVNNACPSQKQRFHLPFARGKIIVEAKIHK